MTVQKIIDAALKESGLENTKIYTDYFQLEEDREDSINYMYSSIISKKDLSSENHQFERCKKLFDFSEILKNKLPEDIKSEIYLLGDINEYRHNIFPFILELRFMKNRNSDNKTMTIPGQMSLF